MTNTPKTLTTTEAREYIRDHTGRTVTPSKGMLNRWQQLKRIAPHKRGYGREQNTYLLTDVQEFCDKDNDGYWRKAGQRKREYATLEID